MRYKHALNIAMQAKRDNTVFVLEMLVENVARP